MDNRRRMMLAGGSSADPVLENNDWATISEIARAGEAAQYWNIGDLKNISIGGVTYAAQIIGFDHDDVTDPATYGRTKAGITFQLQNCLNTTYPMNSSDKNMGGWRNSYMRQTVLANIYNQLATDDTELKNAIVLVTKPYSAAYNSVNLVYCSDYLFLLSEIEVSGSIAYSPLSEGAQYAYYAAGNSYSKTVNNVATTWWERSVYKGDSKSFTGVYPTTGRYFAKASSNYGVAFAFCV